MIRYAIKQPYVDILEFIARKKPNMRQVQKKTNKTYMHIRDVLIYCQEKKIIKPVFGEEREGRDHKIELTKKGKIILNLFKLIKDVEDIEPKDMDSVLKGK